MQVNLDDIGGGEPRLAAGRSRRVRESPPARVTPTGLFFLVALSRCDDHAVAQAFGPHGHFWAVVEAAHHLTLQSVAGTDLGADADAPGPADDQAPCSLCLGSR